MTLLFGCKYRLDISCDNSKGFLSVGQLYLTNTTSKMQIYTLKTSQQQLFKEEDDMST